MLFEIDGIGAHEEDSWIGAEVRIGEATVVFNGDIGRCVVTSRDPDTGVIDLPTLVDPRELPPGRRIGASPVRGLRGRARSGPRARGRHSTTAILAGMAAARSRTELKRPLDRLREQIVTGDRGYFFAAIAGKVAERRVQMNMSQRELASCAARRSRR